MKRIIGSARILAVVLALPCAGLAMENTDGSASGGEAVSWDDIAKIVGKDSKTAFRIAKEKGAQARLQSQAALICALTEALQMKYESNPAAYNLPEGVWGDKLPVTLRKLVEPRTVKGTSYYGVTVPGGLLTQAKESAAAGMPPNVVMERLFQAKGQLVGLKARLQKGQGTQGKPEEALRQDAVRSIDSLTGLIDKAFQDLNNSRVQD